MPGPQSRQPDEQHVSWKVHVDHLIECIKEQLAEMDRRYQQRFEAQETALKTAMETAKEYRVQANEWRQAMIDREARFVQVGAYEVSNKQIVQQIEALKEANVKLVPAAIYDARHRELEIRIAELKEAKDKGAGIGIGWSYLLGFFGLVGSIAAIVLGIYAATRH